MAEGGKRAAEGGASAKPTAGATSASGGNSGGSSRGGSSSEGGGGKPPEQMQPATLATALLATALIGYQAMSGGGGGDTKEITLSEFRRNILETGEVRAAGEKANDKKNGSLTPIPSHTPDPTYAPISHRMYSLDSPRFFSPSHVRNSQLGPNLANFSSGFLSFPILANSLPISLFS